MENQGNVTFSGIEFNPDEITSDGIQLVYFCVFCFNRFMRLPDGKWYIAGSGETWHKAVSEPKAISEQIISFLETHYQSQIKE